MSKSIKLKFQLWPKQLYAFRTWATEWLYGGAAGGGKSHLERVLSICWCMDIPGLNYFLFRRNFQDLVKTYIDGENGYQAMLGPLINDPDVKHADVVAKEIRFPYQTITNRDGKAILGADGKPIRKQSKIYLCHAQHEKNVLQFGSFEFHVLNIAEAGEFTEFMINYLRSRVRMPVDMLERLPKKYWIPKPVWQDPEVIEYQFPRVAMSANPVGPGKAFLQKNFVECAPHGKIWRAHEDDGGMYRQFIPAKLTDNKSLSEKQYRSKLKGIGKKAYVDALLDGNWKATIGQFFPQISKDLHLIKPFMFPKHWPRFCVMDWGAAGEGDPFSIGWYALACENVPVHSSITNTKLWCQADSMICYRRWNGRGEEKTTAKKVALGIKERESGESILFRVAGGDILEQRGHGESIFQIFSDAGLKFRRADMRRQNGWAQVDYRLDGENGYPLSFWFEECEEDLDTMSNLQYHAVNLSDIANNQNDHDADRHRYAAMTRPCGIELEPEKEIDLRDKNRRATVKTLIDRISQPEKRTYVTRR